MGSSRYAMNCLFIHLLFLVASARMIHGEGRRFDFHVKYTTITRLCHTKQIVTINDRFPGPSVFVHEGDRVLINVTNELPDKNITIHWHGVRQLRSGWFDGPAYITQCPIQPGRSYLYNFTVAGQRGTLFWHAHISWMRSTVHGAFIIRPKPHNNYPFPTPAAEIPIVLGEWWNANTEAVIDEALVSGGGPNVSDAYTINGKPGALYKCSEKDTFKVRVKPNQTYLLRIINAALNHELFVSVANHTLTVVEVDACYTKPFSTDTILLGPGQTTNVLLTANQPSGKYALAVRAYNSAGPNVPFDNTTSIAIIKYAEHSESAESTLPSLPPYDDTTSANKFTASLRSLHSKEFPARVPKTVDRTLLFTVGLARKPCPHGRVCQGPSGGKFGAAINNISFNLPTTSLLQTFFSDARSQSMLSTNENKAKLVFPTDFPDMPTIPFNFTGTQPKNLTPKRGTRLSRLAYNSSVQLILQGTSILGTESHPIHLHGFNFFVVGQGLGNYNNKKDPILFNLVDPQERNTINVPKGGWVALRFRADNPGVWFMHCHLEIHASWGLETAFLVPNGVGPKNSIESPPFDFPTC